jgi:hypothetical protein
MLSVALPGADISALTAAMSLRKMPAHAADAPNYASFNASQWGQSFARPQEGKYLESVGAAEIALRLQSNSYNNLGAA